MANKSNFPDLDLHLLNVQEHDTVSRKMLMLIEGVYGKGPKHSYEKYKFSEQRYYQLLKEFQLHGTASLIDQKRGPKKNSIRTEKIVQQIIRYRFLDPSASAMVITQKLKQTGFSVSLRSVERTIQEFGLQKKTLSVKPK